MKGGFQATLQEQNQMTKTTNYKFRTTLKEEKETIINFDYEEEVIHLYSTNQSTCKKLTHYNLQRALALCRSLYLFFETHRAS